ncbi:hypothetical protein VNO77_26767 [Canavalia gladiata]|uniref:Uncharacterized protein n=1 Tax=Canavalia gladiata TaxID=3824 RepID=A0AAN9Q5V6_CANGL
MSLEKSRRFLLRFIPLWCIIGEYQDLAKICDSSPSMPSEIMKASSSSTAVERTFRGRTGVEEEAKIAPKLASKQQRN